MRWIPLALLGAAVGALGLVRSAGPDLLRRHDGFSHAAGGALLALCLILAVPRASLGRILLLCVSAAGLLEVVQTFVPGRTGSLTDLMLGAAGSVVVLVGAFALGHGR